MLHSNLRHDYLRVHLAKLDASQASVIEGLFAALEREASAALAREGFAPGKTRLLRALDLRYVGQQWDISVNVAGRFDPVPIRCDFDAMHERLFGHTQPGGTIEITKLRASGLGLIAPLAHASMPPAAAPATWRERRAVWIDERIGWYDTPVYAGAALLPGHTFVGPAIVDEQTTTLLVGAGERLEVDATGNYGIDLGGRA
jgi:N-methylhydantoinase A